MPPLESTVRGSKAQLDKLPSVDRILSWKAVSPLIQRHGRTLVTFETRAQLDEWRKGALAGHAAPAMTEAIVADAIAARIDRRLAPALRPVFNLTGTVLHTNLGRALLPEEATIAVARAMRAPTNLEFDLASGERGERDTLIEALLCELTGAEAATVVNNNAAA